MAVAIRLSASYSIKQNHHRPCFFMNVLAFARLAVHWLLVLHQVEFLQASFLIAVFLHHL